MTVVKVETLIERLRMVTCSGLAKVERDEISRIVVRGEERGVREVFKRLREVLS